jgi:hypothetical protein
LRSISPSSLLARLCMTDASRRVARAERDAAPPRGAHWVRSVIDDASQTFLAGLVMSFGLSPFGGLASRLFCVDARLRFPGEPRRFSGL